MKNAVIVVYDPTTNIINTVKYGEFDVLLNLIEPFVIVAMKMKEKVLFFEVTDTEKNHINHLTECPEQHISYLKNFKHAQYDIKENQ